VTSPRTGLLPVAAAVLAALCAPVAAHAQEARGELVVFVFEVGSGAPLRGVTLYAGEPMPPPPPPPEPTELQKQAASMTAKELERFNRKRTRQDLEPVYPPEPPPPPPEPELGKDERLGRTDREGQLQAELPQGEYTLYAQTDDGIQRVTEVRVTQGFRSEVLVTVYPQGGDPSALTEQPEAGRQLTTDDDPEGPVGTIRGTIVSDEDGRPISSARVFVRGSRSDAVTGPDGTFELQVPAGQRDLSIIHDKFATQAVNNVTVVAGQSVSVEVELVPAGLALDAFVIRAPRIEGGTSALLDERRTSSAVGDVLGAEQMARSGDSSAASALTRVTGLTLVGGRYIYVRGLGERYSSVLLNGATLPSPEPGRRVVPLDMFPAGILESVVIQKTYSPDMPGEFGGGSIQLRTKNIPTEPIFSFSLSGGYNSVTTFRQGLDYQGSGWDVLGAGAGSRALPDDIREASEVARIAPSDRFCTENCYTAEDLEKWGESMDQNWATRERTLPPDLGMSMTVGTGGDSALFGRPAGVLFGGSFANQWDRREFTRGYYAIGANEELALQNEYDFVRSENQVNVSGILALGMSPADGHELRATSLVLRRTGDETRVLEGVNAELDRQIRATRLRYVERQLLVQQLSGEHEFIEGGPRFTWRYSLARATRIEPDRRQYQYNYDPQDDVYRMSQRSGGNQRIYADLLDRNHDLGGEFALPVGPEVGDDGFRTTLYLGGMFADKRRGSDTRRYAYIGRGDGARDGDLNQLQPGEIFQPENIGPDAYQFEEVTLPTDNYSASHTLAAVYAKAEIPFTTWFRLMAGARLEHSNQFTTTFPLFASENATTVDSRIKTTDVLPAATATFSPSDKTNIRLGYGRTVSRPDFREMSPAVFVDVVGGRTVTGNPELERATIDNVDARFELYPSAGESLSLGVFYKNFKQPIEGVLVVSSERSSTWENTDGAWLVGVEFDLRKSLEFVTPAMRDFYVAGNVALIESRVTGIGGVGTNSERAMQGQSPYVINATVGYDNPESNTFATLLYNVYGPRITEAGAFGQPDTYQQPVHALDAVAGLTLDNGLKFGLKFTNLLNYPAVYTMGERETERVVNGWNLALKVGWRM